MPLSFASCAKGGTVDRPILGVCTPNSDCYEAVLSLAIVPSVGLAAAGAKRLFFFRSKLSLPGGEGPASRSEPRDGMLFAHPAEPAQQMGDRGAVAQAGGLAERRQIAEESVGHTSIVGDGIAAESSGPASGCCAWKRNSRVPLDWLIRPVRIRSHRHSRKMTKDWPVKGRTPRLRIIRDAGFVPKQRDTLYRTYFLN